MNNNIKTKWFLRLSGWLLRLFFRDSRHKFIIEELEEGFDLYRDEYGMRRSYVWYIVQLIKIIAGKIYNNLFWSSSMFKNYCKIALRNITKNKGYSFINVFGLAIGIASFILISIYVLYELSYDRYHNNAGQIFRAAQVLKEGHAHEGNNLFAGTPMPLAPLLKEKFPEVINVTRFTREINVRLKIENREFFEEELFYTDPDMFNVFSFKFISGDKQTALENPFSLVLSRNAAVKYFGSTDVIGKTVKYDNLYDFSVTGVIENIPQNSHFKFDVLLSLKTLINHPDERYRNYMRWGGPSGYTYLVLKKNTDFQNFNTKIDHLLKTTPVNRDGDYNKLFIQPLKDIHLHSKLDSELSANNDFGTMVILSLIAVLILMIACINYMNLTTAQSSVRVKEVGIRKVFGAQKKQLARQFLTESFLMTFFAMSAALILVKIVLPYYNSFVERQFQFDLIHDSELILSIILLTVLISLFAGSYPAIYISSFKPVLILKNIIHKGIRGKSLRNILVTFQFTISIILIICTIIVKNQLFYINNTELGYDRDNLVVVRLLDKRFRSEKQKLEVIKSELVKHADIYSASSSSHLPGRINSEVLIQIPGKSNIPQFEGDENRVDINFIDLYGIEITEGRSFSREFPSDSKGAFIINETAAGMLGWKDPVNRELVRGTNIRGKIIGVMKDFNAHSLYQNIGPVHLWFQEPLIYQQNLTIRTSGRNSSAVLRYIKLKVNEIAPDFSAEYHFYENIYNNMYKSEIKLEKILTLFSLLGILLSCFGLFGFSSIIMKSRTREIGIRKVCGASTGRIIFLISKEYVKLVLFANILAWPAAWFLMNSWLKNFAYKTMIDTEIFFITGFATLMIGLATVGFKSVKSSLTNPVDTLKYE